MRAQCGNCWQIQDVPAHLWRRVTYLAPQHTTKTVCPGCYEYAKAHPDKAKVTS